MVRVVLLIVFLGLSVILLKLGSALAWLLEAFLRIIGLYGYILLQAACYSIIVITLLIAWHSLLSPVSDKVKKFFRWWCPKMLRRSYCRACALRKNHCVCERGEVVYVKLICPVCYRSVTPFKKYCKCSLDLERFWFVWMPKPYCKHIDYDPTETTAEDYPHQEQY